MPRINFDDRWLVDPRREDLSAALGNPLLVEGVVYRLWRASQDYWVKKLLIPGHVFVRLPHAETLLKIGLVRVYPTNEIWLYPDRSEKHPNVPERSPNETERDSNAHRTTPERPLTEVERCYVYANGSREYHFWLIEGQLQRVQAGKRSAEKRRLKHGTAQPKPKNLERSRTEPERPRTVSNYSTSVSSSFSSSDSVSSLGVAGQESRPTPLMVPAGSLDELIGDSEGTTPGSRVWKVYAEGIQAKYKKPPIRNRDTNRYFKQLVEKLGEDEARETVLFYLKDNKKYYEDNLHDPKTLLNDAEKLSLKRRSGIDSPIRKDLSVSEHNQAVLNKYLNGSGEHVQ